MHLLDRAMPTRRPGDLAMTRNRSVTEANDTENQRFRTRHTPALLPGSRHVRSTRRCIEQPLESSNSPPGGGEFDRPGQRAAARTAFRLFPTIVVACVCSQTGGREDGRANIREPRRAGDERTRFQLSASGFFQKGRAGCPPHALREGRTFTRDGRRTPGVTTPFRRRRRLIHNRKGPPCTTSTSKP